MPFLYPEQEVLRRALAWARKLRVNPSTVRIQPLKDRWGSCSPTGEVTLAEDLALMDQRFQDYVIVHELLHLRLPGHSRRFNALMTAHVPEWRKLSGDARERHDV